MECGMKVLIPSQSLKFGMDDSFHPTLYDGCDNLSMLELNLNHASKRGPRYQINHLYGTQPLSYPQNKNISAAFKYSSGSISTWWRHQMETFSAFLALCEGNSPVTGEFPSQRPVTRSFDVFFDLRQYKQLSKQSWGWWFETPLHSLWRHCNEVESIPRTDFFLEANSTHKQQ